MVVEVVNQVDDEQEQPGKHGKSGQRVEYMLLAEACEERYYRPHHSDRFDHDGHNQADGKDSTPRRALNAEE